jgi:hypothetical protein
MRLDAMVFVIHTGGFEGRMSPIYPPSPPLLQPATARHSNIGKIKIPSDGG